jgi:hypothetical protein
VLEHDCALGVRNMLVQAHAGQALPDNASQGRLAGLDWLASHVDAVQLQQVEGEQESGRLVPALTQHLEDGHSTFVAADDFPVDQAGANLKIVYRLHNQGETARPIVAIAGKQTDAHGIAPGHQPIAVVLDLMDPIGAGRGLVGGRRLARFNEDILGDEMGSEAENRVPPLAKSKGAAVQRPLVDRSPS